MNITSIADSLYFSRRRRAIEQYATRAEEIQRNVLRRLLHANKDTVWGKQHGYADMAGYEAFSSQVPVQTYEEIKPYVARMMRGEQHVLCASDVEWFAQSSGTTNDKSKFIPVSKQALQDTHYMGGADALTLYFARNPQSRLFSGKSLILGGSHRSNPEGGKRVGDLSAILIENINPLINLMRVPTKEVALMSDWEEKIERMTVQVAEQDVTNLSGVPSWMLVVLQRVLQLKGKQNIKEVWPNLDVFFHGGVAFTPYREQYKALIADPMYYMETYNASEGYFGTQDDPTDPAMLLMIDYGVFFEFLPPDRLNDSTATPLPLWAVTPGRNYAVLITTSSGLWRYVIGDTVSFTSTHPYKFVITGRTKHFINAFGEELMVSNAEKALAQACQATGATVRDYSAAPVFMDEQGKCRHQWLIEFDTHPKELDTFVSVLDETLKTVNSDYEAKRSHNIALQMPEVIVARDGLFYDWLQQRGKLGGQHKVPRLMNDRTCIESMLELNG